LASRLDLPLDRPFLLALLAVEVAALAWWRTWPLPALVVATAASGVLTVAAATHIAAEPSVFVLIFAAGAFAAPPASGCTVAACGVVLEAEVGLFEPGRPLTAGDWVMPVVVVGGLWLVGVLVRQARRHAEALRAERAAGRSRARLTDERLRIARELHDLVAHHASAVAVQASAARSNPAALPDAVTHIEEGGLRIAEAVRALADLAPPTRPPAPLSRAGVEELLVPARAAGLPVTADVEGEPAAEPGEADLFAHRIVVEALTNVLRHAGPSATRLRVQHRPGEVVVEVRDSGVLPGHRTVTRGSGLGLVGVRERAALLGGAAEAGPDPGEPGWVVRARLPRTLPAAAPPA
jgi:signal transduction histidine kinase